MKNYVVPVNELYFNTTAAPLQDFLHLRHNVQIPYPTAIPMKRPCVLPQSTKYGQKKTAERLATFAVSY